MKVLKTTIRIDRPQRDVFDFMLDLRNAPRWLALIDRMEAPEPLGPGSRIRLVLANGKEQSTVLEAHDPPQAYTMHTVENGFDARFAYQLVPDEQGTIVTFTVDVRPVTASAWIVFPFAVRGTRERLGDRLERLKAAMG